MAIGQRLEVRPELKLKDKVSVVTGTASGMGRAICKLFASAGSKVVIADVNRDGLDNTLRDIEDRGGEATSIVADVSQRDQVKRMIDSAVNKYGKLDILVNNAGIVEMSNITEIEDELWDRVLKVNLYGPYWACKYAIPYMVKQGKGVIINVASIAGWIGAAGGVAYTTSKHALIGLTRQTAVAYGPQGIRVNAICPGAVKTGMLPDELLENQSDPLVQKILSVPGRKVGDPEDIAQLALFLASDDSDFIYGQPIVIDGGWLVQS